MKNIKFRKRREEKFFQKSKQLHKISAKIIRPEIIQVCFFGCFQHGNSAKILKKVKYFGPQLQIFDSFFGISVRKNNVYKSFTDEESHFYQFEKFLRGTF